MLSRIQRCILSRQHLHYFIKHCFHNRISLFQNILISSVVVILYHQDINSFGINENIVYYIFTNKYFIIILCQNLSPLFVRY